MLLRAVLDTDVVLAAFDSPHGASRQLVVAALEGRIEIVATTALFLEYEAVLTRETSLSMFGLAAEEVREVLDGLAGVCIAASPPPFRWRPQADDPDDDHLIEAALGGAADVITTFNIRDLAAAGRRWSIAVERPRDTLRRMRG